MLKFFLRYSFIGVINTLFGYIIIFYLTYKNFLPEVANLIGYSFGFIFSYILNKKYNFKSSQNYKRELPKFLFSMTISYILNLITLIFLYNYLEVNVYISQIIAGIVYLISGFLLSTYYTFNLKKSSK